MILDVCTILDSHAFPVREGVVWLFLACIAEVTPVVSLVRVPYFSSLRSSLNFSGVH